MYSGGTVRVAGSAEKEANTQGDRSKSGQCAYQERTPAEGG
jgi:hypothetical protein